jgi:predicted nuclease of predicted toxin-antitoxin system
VLLDENVDRRLKRSFAGKHDIVTVAEAGWAGKKNGELLRLAEREFDTFVTTDKGIPHQQNLSGLGLAIVLLRARSNAREDLEPLMDQVNVALDSARPGSVVRIPPAE